MTAPPVDDEFGFELLVCRWAERAWPPTRRTDAVPVVGRQLGTRERRWDTVVIEADPAGLAARREFGTRALDSDLLHVVRHAPAEWAWYRDALPDPGYPWRYVRAAVHRADARGVVDTRRDGQRIQIRRIAPYPDWVRRVVAIENKPDLDASAARRLGDQLAHDVETALADEAWLATVATGERVEPALLADVPVEAGVLVLSFGAGADCEGSGVEAGADAGSGTGEGGERPDPPAPTARLVPDPDVDARVAWEPSKLDPSADAPSMDAGEKRERRLELAERTYGSGWRSYVETMRPDCRAFELRDRTGALVPWCAAKGCHQTAAECSGSCPSFEPEPPAWRTRGWPIAGGPGTAIERLLAARRERRR